MRITGAVEMNTSITQLITGARPPTTLGESVLLARETRGHVQRLSRGHWYVRSGEAVTGEIEAHVLAADATSYGVPR